MNKKFFLGMFAAASMLLATSCSNDELDVVQSGNEAQVSFSLGLEGGIATRAISDGTGAKKLVCAVYDATGNLLDKVVINNKQVDDNGQYINLEAFQGGLKDQINVTLAKGQEYTMVFWAQNGGCDAYDTDNLKAVRVDYTNGAEGTSATGDINNDDSSDAFFAAETFKVEGNKEIDVTLKRPFAQINVGVTAEDWEAAVASNIEIEKSAVVIKNVADEINLLTGAVKASDAMANGITYTLGEIPDETLYVETDATKDGKEAYVWLSMSYILVDDGSESATSVDGAQKSTLNGLKYTFTPKTGNSIEFAQGLAGAPVQRNWRTNILGKILTGDIQFNITIDPVYDGDYIYPDGTIDQELKFAATFGGTVTMSEDVTLTEPLKVVSDMTLNLNGHNITNQKDNASTDVIVVSEGATLTIYGGEGTIEAVSGNDGYAIISEGTVIINSGTIKSGVDADNEPNAVVYARGNGKVYVNGGYFPNDNNSKYVLNKKDADRATTSIEVKGGTFENFNPANNIAEGEGTNFVAEGYKSTNVGENQYMVVAEGTSVVSSSADLVTAFEKGGQVILADNIELEKKLTVKAGAEVYLDMNGKTIKLEGTAADPAFYTYKGSTLTITGNGTVEINDPSVSLIFPGGDVVIENGTFVRNIPAGTPANQVGSFFLGAKVSPWGSQTVTINGGYFDGGYYNTDAADVDEILAGTKNFEETDDDIANRGNSKDANKVRVALKQNVNLLLNLSSNLFKIYGGTFVGASPAWGDEGCMLPTTPNYLRPWSYYQGALLDGQTFNENCIVLPEGYTITKGALEDVRPTYTVIYNK